MFTIPAPGEQGCFGKNTAKAIKENNLKLDIKAPMKDVPSMTRAIELYIKQSNNL